MYVKAKSYDQKFTLSLGAVFDSYATDNYITHKYANKLGLVGHVTTLCVEGFNKHVTNLDTVRYTLCVEDLFGNSHEYECYGVDEITTPEELPDYAGYKSICSKFGVLPNEVKRPKYIDLMVSMRESADLPVKVKSINKLTLFKNCFGKTFGGYDQGLNFTPHVVCFSTVATEMSGSSAAKSRAMKTLVKSATVCASKSIDQQFLDYSLESPQGFVSDHEKSKENIGT